MSAGVNDVAKKTNFEGWLITAVGIGLGLAFLYYTQTGLGKENDAALIPNTPEERSMTSSTR
jgi:hypothetical protein